LGLGGTRGGTAKKVNVDFYDASDNFVFGLQWSPTSSNGVLKQTTDGSNYTALNNTAGAGFVGNNTGAGQYDPSLNTSMSVVFLDDDVTVNGQTVNDVLTYSQIAYLTINFAGTNTGVLIDDVEVVGVPEPASLAAGLGLGGLYALRRRR
jgi:hypothetical protein